METLNEKKLVGRRLIMSLADNKIGELWRTFLPRRKEIINILGNDLISLVVYQSDHFVDFKPTNEFERWAAVEVANFDHIPEDMETFVLQGGVYAVFDYKGLNKDNSIFKYILEIWLPASAYALDDRPHFEILGVNYKNNDPTSEEEIWIPVKAK